MPSPSKEAPCHHDHVMAAVNPVPDPIDELIEQLLVEPGFAAEIDAIEAELAHGKVSPRPGSHNEARRIVGLPDLPTDDPRL